MGKQTIILLFLLFTNTINYALSNKIHNKDSILIENCGKESYKICEKDYKDAFDSGYIYFSFKTILKNTLVYNKVDNFYKNIKTTYKKIDKKNNYYSFEEQYDTIYNLKEKYFQIPIANENEREFIEILGTRFYKDSLTGNKNKYPLRANLISAYDFVFNNKKYLAIFEQEDYNSTNNFVIIFLFEIVNKKPLYIDCIYETSCCNMDCFNDYNNDKLLEVSVWKDYYYEDESELTCYSLNNNSFMKMDNYHLNIIKRDENKYLIDEKKSKWFFDIKEPSK